MSQQSNRLVLHDDVHPYLLNATLFTDYAHKLRTITIPEGHQVTLNSEGSLNFPIGSIISKTFYYPKADNGVLKADDDGSLFKPEVGTRGGLDLEKVRLVETRLLVNRQSGWVALPYVWNNEQTEATLEAIGDIKSLELVNGPERRSFPYIVPDQNQCAGCHGTSTASKSVNPIGPKVANLNRNGYDGNQNQLDAWQADGWLEINSNSVPAMKDWQDTSNTLEDRARSYLDINCGHCHSEKGPADTSGLYLDIATKHRMRLGECKLPIAAGQGTGGNKFSIVPGKPEESILVYRMTSIDPGAMMPELGRSLVHDEGVALIAGWISEMEGSCDNSPSFALERSKERPQAVYGR